MEIALITKESLDYFISFIPDTYKTLLDEDENVMAAGAVAEHMACAAIVFSWENGITQICSLAVADAYRRRGVGTALIRFVQKGRVINRGIMYADLEAIEADESALKFFESLKDFTVKKVIGGQFQYRYQQLKTVKLLEKEYGEKWKIQSICDVPVNVQKQLWNNSKERGMDISIHYMTHQQDYPPEMNLCICDGKEIIAAILVQKLNEKDYYLRQAYSTQQGKQALMKLLVTAKDYLLEYGEQEGMIFFTIHTETALNLLRGILPDVTTLSQRYEAVSIFPEGSW